MADRGKGLKDPKLNRPLTELEKGLLVSYLAQKHDAKRSGFHRDVRLGTRKLGLYSWATRKELPEPGDKPIAIHQSGQHTYGYKDFQGTLHGYGAGTVKKDFEHKALITDVKPDAISFTIADTKNPERFMIQKYNNTYLLINTTKQKPHGYTKQRFKALSPEEVNKIFSSNNIVQGKIDGAAELITVLGDKLESMSYRTHTNTKQPIMYTEKAKLFNEEHNLPSGTVLRSELYGLQGDKAIPANEVSGLLNSTIEKSLATQDENDIKIRHMVYDIIKHGRKDLSKQPYESRYELLGKLKKDMPASFDIATGLRDPEDQKVLWSDIISGNNKLTSEGVVAHPVGMGKPIKVKSYPEADVIIKDVFTEDSKRGLAGGFTYALPDDPDTVVGKVGTGFDFKTKKDMLNNKDNYVGRVARIKAQEQYPSGSYRAPVFVAVHD